MNAYEPGEGILPHQDGPFYHPAVAIVSLGASAVLEFTPHASLLDAASASDEAPPPVVRVFVPRRSLLLFAHDAYERYLHGIPAMLEDDVGGAASGVCNPHDAGGSGGAVRRDALRVSLTCRSVLKVRRNLLPTRA